MGSFLCIPHRVASGSVCRALIADSKEHESVAHEQVMHRLRKCENSSLVLISIANCRSALSCAPLHFCRSSRQQLYSFFRDVLSPNAGSQVKSAWPVTWQ